MAWISLIVLLFDYGYHSGAQVDNAKLQPAFCIFA
jgi:hypothetical protein